MLRHLPQRASPSSHGTCRGPLTEAAIMEQAEQHSQRLGKLLIAASNAVWKHNELIREVRHGYGAPRRGAVDRLAALNASYDAAPAAGPAPAKARRFHTGLRNIAANMAGGATVMIIALGLAAFTHPATLTDADTGTIRETWTAGPADAEAIRQAVETAAAAIEALQGDARACRWRARLIHPVWRH